MPLNEFRDYDEYWEKRKNVPLLHRYQVVADRINDGSRVIDIGCGEGTFLEYLLSKKSNCRVFGLDVSSVAIRRLREKGIHGAVIGEVEPSSIFDGECDYVVLMEVLEHVQDAEGLFLTAATFKPKSIFVSIPNSGYILNRLRLLFGRFPITAIVFHMKEHIRFWTVRDFKEWTYHLGWYVHSCVGQERAQKCLPRMLLRIWPEMFANQVIFEVRPLSQ